MKLYDIYEAGSAGYHKLFHHQNWRVAILNYIDDLALDNIRSVEAHLETDEAFVLLEGDAVLVLGQCNQGDIKGFECVRMQPGQVYKIPKGVYHAVTMTEDAKVLIIEEENTCPDNSPTIPLDAESQQMMKARIRASGFTF
ncbi:MAG: hypothetical protein EA375_03110 [Acholeplasmataceae bacterium]|nr:MAG: hypothetical protein EA375_03110 [Acholeplasmataceae bacterium]